MLRKGDGWIRVVIQALVQLVIPTFPISLQCYGYLTILPTDQHHFNPLPCLPKDAGDVFLTLATREFPTCTIKTGHVISLFYMCLETICLSSEKSLCTLERRKNSLMALVLLGLMTMEELALNLYTA